MDAESVMGMHNIQPVVYRKLLHFMELWKYLIG